MYRPENLAEGWIKDVFLRWIRICHSHALNPTQIHSRWTIHPLNLTPTNHQNLHVPVGSTHKLLTAIPLFMWYFLDHAEDRLSSLWVDPTYWRRSDALQVAADCGAGSRAYFLIFISLSMQHADARCWRMSPFKPYLVSCTKPLVIVFGIAWGK